MDGGELEEDLRSCALYEGRRSLLHAVHCPQEVWALRAREEGSFSSRVRELTGSSSRRVLLARGKRAEKQDGIFSMRGRRSEGQETG